MENQLMEINQNETLTIDSREVAEMISKEHSKLMRDIRNYCNYLNEANFGLVDYFIESTYLDIKGEERPCYLITKKGCEICANKMIGKKGVIFTAKYVDKFNQMEQYIKQDNQFKLPQTYKQALLQLVEQVEKNELLEEENKVLNNENNLLAGQVLEWADSSIINALVRKYGATLGKDFAGGWKAWKSEMLYKYSINVNSRIEKEMSKTGKATKPKTLSMLRTNEELSNGLRVAVALCRDKEIDITKELGKHISEV